MKEKIVEVLNLIGFLDRYKALCTNHSNYEFMAAPTEEEVEKIFLDKGISPRFVSVERSFVHREAIGLFAVKFVLKYKGYSRRNVFYGSFRRNSFFTRQILRRRVGVFAAD